VLFEAFLLYKVSFESDTSMKGPCITRAQSLGVHDVVNDQGFTMHYRAFFNTVSHLEVFRCERINTANSTAKQKDGLASFLMLSVLECSMFNVFNMIF